MTPILNWRLLKSPREIKTTAAKINAIPIHIKGDIFSLKKKYAKTDVEIISKEVNNDALDADIVWSPSSKVIVAPAWKSDASKRFGTSFLVNLFSLSLNLVKNLTPKIMIPIRNVPKYKKAAPQNGGILSFSNLEIGEMKE